jgi:leader peptidase (prepilin peptidase)/N-methyltransferase
LSEPAALILFAFMFGAVFGSFANVIIYRLPKGESIVFPGSHCGSCGAKVRWFDNVPILAWFYLLGRCRSCRAKFSIRYPAVELTMACLFALAAAKFGLSFRFSEALLFIFAIVTASVIDIDHMILPDKFTLSGIVIGLVGAALSPERTFIDAAIGAAAGIGFLWAIAYLYYVLRGREGMGGGDVKLLGWIGAVLGWKSIPIVILGSSLVGSVGGMLLILFTRGTTKDGMKQAIPFGPFLGAAALVYLFFDGSRWADWYFALHGL